MCNLYSVTKGQQAIREAFRAMTDRTGNLPRLPGIFPDQMAPVIRQGADGRELAMLRWGFPSPPGVPGNQPVTNIRNVGSSYWRAWMKPEYRCLVPATRFCEYTSGNPAVSTWFDLEPTTHCLRLPVCGGLGRAPAAQRLTRPKASTTCLRT